MEYREATDPRRPLDPLPGNGPEVELANVLRSRQVPECPKCGSTLSKRSEIKGEHVVLMYQCINKECGLLFDCGNSYSRTGRREDMYACERVLNLAAVPLRSGREL